jgi:uncharacterized protein YigA (DUF484 family)
MDNQDFLQINEDIGRKFERIEAALDGCPSAAELLETLVRDIEAAFGVPFVWLSLLHSPETTELLGLLERSSLLHDRLNVLTPDAFLELLHDPVRPRLASGNLRPFFRLLPPRCKYLIRSMAIAPLWPHGRLIGSLNLGDASTMRYVPGMKTTRLTQLAKHVSAGLTQRLPPFSA